MKILTKSIKNRIYTICINVDENRVTITRGRGGLSDTKPIFNDEGCFDFVKDGLSRRIVRSGTFFIGSEGESYDITEVEKLVEPIILELVKKLETSMQKE